MSSPVGLIARREVVTRLQQKFFRISFLVTLLIVVIACVLPAFLRGDDTASHFDVAVAIDSPGLSGALSAVARAQHVEVTVHASAPQPARDRVRSGSWDAAVLPGGELVVRHSGDSVVKLVQAADQLSRTVTNLRSAGLTDRQVSQAMQVAPLRVATTASGQNSQKQAIASSR